MLYLNQIDIIMMNHFKQYENIKKEIDYVFLKNYTNEINNIILSDDFIKEILLILKSNPVQYYLSSKRIFDNINEYGIKFILDNEHLIEDQCLKTQYDQFLKDIKDNGNDYFRKLIRIKGLAYKIPALTGPTMKMFLNPIQKFSDIAKSDESQRTNILKSALIILLIHEIVQLLKYYHVNKNYPDEMPTTPKNKENGKCLIYYLFGKGAIDHINNEQASLINDMNNWKSVEKLRTIFVEQQDIKDTNNKKEEDKNIQLLQKIGELDLYFSGEQKLKKSKKILKKTDYCYW